MCEVCPNYNKRGTIMPFETLPLTVAISHLFFWGLFAKMNGPQKSEQPRPLSRPWEIVHLSIPSLKATKRCESILSSWLSETIRWLSSCLHAGMPQRFLDKLPCWRPTFKIVERYAWPRRSSLFLDASFFRIFAIQSLMAWTNRFT